MKKDRWWESPVTYSFAGFWGRMFLFGVAATMAGLQIQDLLRG